mmetsp:Transcript_5756/g.9164  ORF Transcript_5756/g.9164 Transcript_5756/m.9164 type:complete len:113 (+) Transcript_5756:1316-1654(+)
MECIRNLNIELHHLLRLKEIFLNADESRCGFVSRKQLIEGIHDSNHRFPRAIVNFFMNALVVVDQREIKEVIARAPKDSVKHLFVRDFSLGHDYNSGSVGSLLSFNKLQSII